jgi:hypothetical protein
MLVQTPPLTTGIMTEYVVVLRRVIQLPTKRSKYEVAISLGWVSAGKWKS